MVTTVGLNSDFNEVLKDLISLDFDAVEAYQASIDRLENKHFREKLAEFKQDHIRHTKMLSNLARNMGIKPPVGPDMKAALAKGKVVIADIFGDKAILIAMKTNEDDTNTAYERATKHKDLSVEAREIVEAGLADERRHRAWIEDTISKISDKAA
jgi:uncharacterized protein (TIGR02284 family)